MNSYLDMVRGYLSQELPPPYNNLILVLDGRIKIVLPETGNNFDEEYAILHSMIIERISRIRNIRQDLDFTVWTPDQLRDFSIATTAS